MRDIENIQAASDAGVSLMGFIFYEKSKRFIQPELRAEIFSSIPDNIKKVGVFVNESIDFVKKIVHEYNLDFVQLHGEEDPSYCEAIKTLTKVIKAFSVDESFDFSITADYQSCDYLLFDAKGKERGGNGIQYNWDILQQYTLDTPFLLSGGLGPEDAGKINSFKHKKLAGIDVNSGFESAPAMKNIENIKSFISKLTCNTQ
nr:phosphoribosylanthranilate isomerase [Portibacter lacus]